MGFECFDFPPALRCRRGSDNGDVVRGYGRCRGFCSGGKRRHLTREGARKNRPPSPRRRSGGRCQRRRSGCGGAPLDGVARDDRLGQKEGLFLSMFSKSRSTKPQLATMPSGSGRCSRAAGRRRHARTRIGLSPAQRHTARRAGPYAGEMRVLRCVQADRAATASLTCCIWASESGMTGLRHSPTGRPVRSLAALATGLNGMVQSSRLIG